MDVTDCVAGLAFLRAALDRVGDDRDVAGCQGRMPVGWADGVGEASPAGAIGGGASPLRVRKIGTPVPVGAGVGDGIGAGCCRGGVLPGGGAVA